MSEIEYQKGKKLTDNIYNITLTRITHRDGLRSLEGVLIRKRGISAVRARYENPNFERTDYRGFLRPLQFMHTKWVRTKKGSKSHLVIEERTVNGEHNDTDQTHSRDEALCAAARR